MEDTKSRNGQTNKAKTASRSSSDNRGTAASNFVLREKKDTDLTSVGPLQQYVSKGEKKAQAEREKKAKEEAGEVLEEAPFVSQEDPEVIKREKKKVDDANAKKAAKAAIQHAKNTQAAANAEINAQINSALQAPSTVKPVFLVLTTACLTVAKETVDSWEDYCDDVPVVAPVDTTPGAPVAAPVDTTPVAPVAAPVNTTPAPPVNTTPASPPHVNTTPASPHFIVSNLNFSAKPFVSRVNVVSPEIQSSADIPNRPSGMRFILKSQIANSHQIRPPDPGRDPPRIIFKKP